MDSVWLKTLFVLGTTVVLGACSAITPGWRNDVRETVDGTLKEATAPKLPGEVSQALLPPIEITLPDGKTAPIEPRFDLNVNNAPARQVFMGLIEGTPYSMILHPEVRGNVTLHLKEVTVPEAISAIRHVYGYEYRREGNRFLILGRDIQTRVFNVNYLTLVRRGLSGTRVAASGLTTSAGSATSGATTTAAGGSVGASGAMVETQSQADFWKELQATLSAIIGEQGGRRVIVNPQSSIVLVRAYPDELRVVEEFLGTTHAAVQRQVVLEAKILDVELKDGFQAGINWAAMGTIGNTNIVGAQTGGGTVFNETGLSNIAGNTGNLNPGAGYNPVTGTAVSAFGGVFALAAKSSDFAAFIELLKSQGEVQVLSSPRVATLNNQKAVIKVGTDEFYVIKQDVTQSTTAGVAPTVSTELAPFFSGIALDVTPQIDEFGNINLHIHPSVSEVREKKISVGGSITQQLSTAASSVQESDNIVRAGSGQIIVIGGLMKEATTDQNAAVPLFGDIPLIGNLFKHRKVTRIKKELVILLKPTVVNTAQDWNDAARESETRVKKLKIGS